MAAIYKRKQDKSKKENLLVHRLHRSHRQTKNL